jgi:hypothetical protein
MVSWFANKERPRIFEQWEVEKNRLHDGSFEVIEDGFQMPTCRPGRRRSCRTWHPGSYHEENETKLFAARLRTLADLVEQDKITSAIVYAFVDGMSPTAEFNAPIFPHLFAGQFCNCCDDDFTDFLDQMHSWATAVHARGGVSDFRDLQEENEGRT